MQRGRTITRIAIALGLGAVINVLVAYSALLFDAKHGVSREYEATPWPISVPSDWPTLAGHSIRYDFTLVSTRIYYENTREQARAEILRWPSISCRICEHMMGWPCLAVVNYEGFGPNDPGPNMRGPFLRDLELSVWYAGLPLSGNPWASRLTARNRMPIKPLWPGFAINTLFYGTLVSGAMTGIAALKRRRRAKRGLCIQCAYPLTRGDLCPECGTAVRGAAKTPATPTEPVGSTPE